MCQKGSAVERRQSKRKQIEVDIEIAQPGFQRCYGFAGNISRKGVSVHLWKGELPNRKRAVILNFILSKIAYFEHRDLLIDN